MACDSHASIGHHATEALHWYLMQVNRRTDEHGRMFTLGTPPADVHNLVCIAYPLDKGCAKHVVTASKNATETTVLSRGVWILHDQSRLGDWGINDGADYCSMSVYAWIDAV